MPARASVRASARAQKFSKSMNPRLSIAHIPMFISLLDRLIRNIWWDHKKWWKITKMCDFRKIHEKSNPQMKNDQISKKSKIRLKCRMKFIFSCWLGWGIVFFKKNHSWTTGTHPSFDSQHLVRPRKMMENRQNDWFSALSSQLAPARQNFRKLWALTFLSHFFPYL